MKKKPTGGNISFLDMYESMDHVVEAKVTGLKDDRLKKLYNQMKDEQLSGSAAAQFKDIVREMKKRKISLTEAKKVKVVKTGKGDFVKYQLMTPSGDELIDMDFDSEGAAKAYAKKKGFKLVEARVKLSKGDRAIFNWSQINVALSKLGYAPKKIADVLAQLMRDAKEHRESKHLLSNRVKSSRVSEALEEAIETSLLEGSTENAAKTLDAILGMFAGKHDNDIYKMGKGIKDYYKKEKSFSPDQAKWIWKTSVALFKK